MFIIAIIRRLFLEEVFIGCFWALGGALITTATFLETPVLNACRLSYFTYLQGFSEKFIRMDWLELSLVCLSFTSNCFMMHYSLHTSKWVPLVHTQMSHIMSCTSSRCVLRPYKIIHS
jgi:hypothetical protein